MLDGAGRSINTLLTKENIGLSFLNDFIIFSLPPSLSLNKKESGKCSYSK